MTSRRISHSLSQITLSLPKQSSLAPKKAEPQNLNAKSKDESEKKNEVIDKNTDRIYNDILSAINDNSQNETEQTSRRNKYSGDDNHFIDITNQYQKPREEEKAPAENIAIVRPSKDKKPEEKPEEKPEDEQNEEKTGRR